jgi:hypothetical protein
MTIKRGGLAEPVSGTISTKEITTYCPKCLNLHIRSKLGPRVYKDEELTTAGQLPSDHDQWRQCYHCGLLIPLYDIAKEGQLTTDIERIDSKFKGVKETEHYEKPKHRRGFNERLDDDSKRDEIKDPEVKALLKKGAKLINYFEK